MSHCPLTQIALPSPLYDTQTLPKDPQFVGDEVNETQAFFPFPFPTRISPAGQAVQQKWSQHMNVI